MTAKIKERIDKTHFHVTIFGSARIKKGDPNWNLVYELAKGIAKEGMDLVTGGGPGLMDAASEGHHAGSKSDEAHSIGLQIKLPKEQRDANHLDIKKEFSRFSQRLDTFVQLSNAVVVAPGGVGTLLELFYSWQLMQVNMTCNIPIILLGDMWPDMVHWIKKWPLKNRLLDQKDVDSLFLVDNSKDALVIIKKAYEDFLKGDEHFCLNYEKYKI